VSSLLLLAGGGVAAYLLLRPRDAQAHAQLVPTPLPTPTPSPTPSTDRSPAVLARPPHITATATPTRVPELPLSKPTSSDPLVLPGQWGWPVPRWEGRAPVVSDGFGSPRPGMKHMGVDIMFARIASDPFAVGTPNGTKGFVMPDAWMAVAASDGILWSSGHTPRGFAVVIDHGAVATFYTHLDTLFVPQVRPPTKGLSPAKVIPIKAGQPLGVIGGDPQTHQRIKHLHFEVWRGGPQHAIDPAPLMKTWRVFTPSDVARFLPPLVRNAKPKNRSEFVSVRGYERRWPGTALHPPR
jgi:murein DD-endopeptidase MepM/ murein hydrolase activator NlpD